MFIKIKNIVLNVKTNEVLVYVLGIALFGYVTKYIFNVMLTHYLRPSLYGDFNIAVKILAILASLSLLGIHHSSKRFVSHYLARHEHKNLVNYIKWNIKVIRISFLTCISIGLFSYFIMHALHLWHIKDIRSYHLAIYMLWVAPLAAIVNILASYLLCVEYPIIYRLIINGVDFISICALMIIVLTLQISFDNQSLTFILFASYFALIVLTILFILNKAPSFFISISTALHSKVPLAIHPDWLTVSTRMAAQGLISLLSLSIDLIVIEMITPNRDAVGLYAVALTISSCLLVIPQNIYTLLAPDVNDLCTTEDGRKKVARDIKQLNRYSMIPTLIIGMGLLIYSKTLLLNFGPIYLQAEPTLKILIFSFIVNAYSRPAVTLLGYGGHEKLLLHISIIEFTVLLVLCVVFTYFFGIEGTAMATAVLFVCKAILCHIIAYRQMQIKTYAF